MKRALASLAFAPLLAGCLSPRSAIPSFAGEYEMGGFNEVTTLSLHLDGSYRISHSMTSCVIDEGGITTWHSDESGHWRFDGRVIVLSSSVANPRQYFHWFSRLRVSQRNGVLTLLSDVPTSPVYTRLGFREKKPNKSPEPTTTSGTSAAEQPRVPAAVVAHL